MKIEQTVYQVLPVGQYAATVREIEEAEGEWGEYAKFTFRIEDEGHAGATITGAASARFSSKSKLYQWTKAILGGRQIPKTWAFDSAALIGRRCVLGLTVASTKDGEFNRIEAIFPAQKPAAAAAPGPTPKPAPAPVEMDDVPWPDTPPPDLDGDESSEDCPF